MKPSKLVAKLWAELESDGVPEADKLRLREAARFGTTSILIGIDGLGHRHMCVSAPDVDAGKQDLNSRGVSIEVRVLLAGEERRQYVDVACTIPALNEMFGIVSGEMV